MCARTAGRNELLDVLDVVLLLLILLLLDDLVLAHRLHKGVVVACAAGAKPGRQRAAVSMRARMGSDGQPGWKQSVCVQA